MSKTLYLLKVSRHHPIFINRHYQFHAEDDKINAAEPIHQIPIPNDLILCDTCNAKIKDSQVYLLCRGPKDERSAIRCECAKCAKKYHSELELIDETRLNFVQELIDDLTPEERNFTVNFFSSKTNDKLTDFFNYRLDLILYQYTHAPQLLFLFSFLYSNEQLVESLI
jgi:hypothetical protein